MSLRDTGKLNYIEDLCNACDKGYLQKVKDWLAQGVDINNTSKEWDDDNKRDIEQTPLYYAAWKGHLEIVRVLLESGAQVNKGRIDIRATPLWIAAQKG